MSSNKCQMVVFSNKAYNAIIRESFDKDPVETGGILLGHILDNGVWIVMEVLPPGIKCIFERAYFEYDDAFVNYLAQSVANQYRIPLELLGLWHRHPGSMDVFSSTDDGTNTTFAQQNPNGVISGLVNIDPRFRLTMYHMDNPINMIRQYNRPNYERIEIEVGDDIIPEEYFQLKYYDGEDSNLNPFVEHSHTGMSRSVRTEGTGYRAIDNEEPLDICSTIQDNLNCEDDNYHTLHDENPSWMKDLTKIWEILKKNKFMSVIAVILVISSIYSFKTAIEWCKSGVETVVSWDSDNENNDPYILKEKVNLKVGEDVTLDVINIKRRQKDKITWKSSNEGVATIDETGKVIGRKVGSVKITLFIDNKYIDDCEVNIISDNATNKSQNYRLSETKLSMKVNEKESLTLEGVKNSAEIQWYSTDNSIVSVKNGEIESKKPGTATINASIAGKIYECSVTVTAIEESVEDNEVIIQIPGWRNSGTASLCLGVAPWKVDISTTGSVNKELIKFRSDTRTIAEVTSDGLVTPVAVGTANIIVLYNGIEQDTLKLTITEKK